MKKSEDKDEIKALRDALKREREKNARLKAKHDADKAEIRKLRRRKDPRPAAPAAADAGTMALCAKKKEEMLKSMKPLGLSDQQKEKLEELFPGITSTSSLFD